MLSRLRSDGRHRVAFLLSLLALVLMLVLAPRAARPADAALGACEPQCNAWVGGEGVTTDSRPGILYSTSDSLDITTMVPATPAHMLHTNWTGTHRYFSVPVDNYRQDTTIIIRNNFNVGMYVIPHGTMYVVSDDTTAHSQIDIDLGATFVQAGSALILSPLASPGGSLYRSLPALNAGWTHIGFILITQGADPTSGDLDLYVTRTQ